jgi:hypothetical protein
MTGQDDNVGFLATESGVKQFQLSLGGCSALQCGRFSPESRLTKYTHNLRGSAAAHYPDVAMLYQYQLPGARSGKNPFS